MADWSGIDLGSDTLDLNLDFGNFKKVSSSSSSSRLNKDDKAVKATSAPSQTPFKVVKTGIKARVGITKKYAESLEKTRTTELLPPRPSSSLSTSSSLDDKQSIKRATPAISSTIPAILKSTDLDPTNNEPSTNYDAPSLPTSSEDAASTVTRKFRRIEKIDDPNLYHAKPIDLSKNALKRPRENLPLRSNIFSHSEFSSLTLNPKLVHVLEAGLTEGGFAIKTATHVQSAAIPLLGESCNTLIRSQTGSGKTLAFLLPLV